MPSDSNQPIRDRMPSWRASLIGGAAAIGGMALLGTLVSNASVWLMLAQGATVQQAYARLSDVTFSPSAVASALTILVSCLFGGHVASALGQGKSGVQGLVAGGIASLFFVVMYLSPTGPNVPRWYLVVSMVLCLWASVLGALWQRRNRSVAAP